MLRVAFAKGKILYSFVKTTAAIFTRLRQALVDVVFAELASEALRTVTVEGT